MKVSAVLKALMVFEAFSDFTKLLAHGAHFMHGKNRTQRMMGHAQGQELGVGWGSSSWELKETAGFSASFSMLGLAAN